VTTRLLPQAVPYLISASVKLVLSTEFDYNNREARMSNQGSEARRSPHARIERIALGSDRAAKIMAVRASIARVAEIDAGWRDASVVARSVQTDAPAMPLQDW
jgi:hypothetical protein